MVGDKSPEWCDANALDASGAAAAVVTVASSISVSSSSLSSPSFV